MLLNGFLPCPRNGDFISGKKGFDPFETEAKKAAIMKRLTALRKKSEIFRKLKNRQVFEKLKNGFFSKSQTSDIFRKVGNRKMFEKLTIGHFSKSSKILIRNPEC
jgi:hypothetical protein